MRRNAKTRRFASTTAGWNQIQLCATYRFLKEKRGPYCCIEPSTHRSRADSRIRFTSRRHHCPPLHHAEKFSTLHAMACTCKTWQAHVEPEIKSVRPLAFDFAGDQTKEILTAINRLLSSLDNDDSARFLQHLAVRIELDKFEFKKAPEQLARLVQLASQRKRKTKCEHASYLLKTLVEQRIVTKDQLKSWVKLKD